MPKQRFSSYATKLTVQWASLWRTRMHCKILSAVIVLVTVVMTSLTHAQSKQFKVELYNRGLEHLRKIESPDIFQLDNAFESAASVDSKTLLDPLLEEFHFKSHSLLDQIAQHADLIEPAQALNWLRKQNFDWTDNATIADLAFKFGTQQANLDQLIDSLGDFIVKDEDGMVPDDDATQAKLRESRIEELHYVYNLGSLGSNAPLKPIEHFHQGISCPILKKHLHAVCPERSKEKLAAKFAFEFAKVGAKSNVVELLERIKDQEEKTWAYFQCAIAFPPRTVRPEPIQYSRRVDGGVF